VSVRVVAVRVVIAALRRYSIAPQRRPAAQAHPVDPHS
jgi:hypothetical protein